MRSKHRKPPESPPVDRADVDALERLIRRSTRTGAEDEATKRCVIVLREIVEGANPLAARGLQVFGPKG